MRHILFLLFMALTLQAIAQYPATGNKMRLGWQTTGDGLIYRGAIGDTATLDPSGINNAWMLLDTSSGNLYAYRAKAWRLVSGGGGLTMPFNSVTFNVNETDASLRELKYSEEKGYLQYGGQDSVQIPILPGIWYVRNDTSVTIPKGTVLRATGTLGASGRIKVKHMIANGSIDAMYIIGIAMHDIAVGADGYAMSQGKIRQVNTQAYSEGAVLYADVDTLGGLTQTEPGNGFLKLPIAFVVHSASNGVLAVRITSGAYMRDLHDVEVTSPATNASLYYNTAQGIWRDTTPAVLKSDISGTANYLAKFTGANTIGNSGFIENGQEVYLGGTTNAFNFSRFSIYYNPVNNGFPIVADTRAYNASPLPGAGWNFGGKKDSTGAYTAFAAIQGAKETSANSEAGYLQFSTNSDGGSAFPEERMRITSAGNVGIGDATPSYKLDVNGTAYATTVITNGNFVGNGQLTTADARSGLVSIGPSSNTVPQYFMGGYGTFYGAGHTTKPGHIEFGVGQNTTGKIVFYTDNFGQNQTMTLTNNSFVGINTASPSRPLHVEGTTAIRIPVGTTSDRGTSANGDIRYNTTNANFEWYSGTGWREPVNAARSPAAGLANRFAKFDANGLLDTSAVLTQSANRIGIGTASPTAGFMLDVVGGDARINGMTVGLGGSNVGSNLAFGNGALASWDGTGSGTNVAIGALALNQARQTLGASSNLAIGGNALRVNTNTANNVAIGADAMRFYNKTGAGAGGGNVAIGGGALYYLEASASTPVANNVAIGLASMLYTQNSDANACIGTSSMRHAQGNDNVAIGQASLASSDPGTPDYRTGISQNVSIGASAMQNIVANTTGNIAIGKSALGLSNYEGDNGVYIGLSANASSTTATNEIVIGANTTGNGSNTTTIGNSSTTATILPAGSLSVSTTSTTNKLNINGNAVIGSSYIGTAAPADGLLVVGNVGIGASSVDYKLHCAGVGYFGTGLRVDYTAAFSDSTIFQLPNTATKKARAFAWNTYSDARIKSNFDTIQNALQAVQALKPVYYDQHDSEVIDGKIKLQDGKTRTVGFIAQDVATVIPAAVQAGNDTQLWGMDYTKLIPYLTKAIQEQQAQIEALKKEIEALKNK